MKKIFVTVFISFFLMKSYAQKDIIELRNATRGDYFVIEGQKEEIDSCGKFIKDPKNLELKFYTVNGTDTMFYKKIADNEYLLLLEDYGYTGTLKIITDDNMYYKYYSKDNVNYDKGVHWFYKDSPYMEVSKEVEINFCKMFAKQQKERTLKLYFVYDGDTLAYEQIGDNKYLHPLRDCGKIKCNIDNRWYLLIDNGRYIYSIPFFGSDLLISVFREICVVEHNLKVYEDDRYKECKWERIKSFVSYSSLGLYKGGYKFSKKKLAKGKYRFGDEK